MNITGEILELDREHFPRPWTEKQWRNLDPATHVLIPWPSGFALLALVSGDDTAHLLKICLHPSVRGHGSAVKFYEAIKTELKARGVQKIFLEVEESNLQAQNFYRKVGFQPLRVIKNFYSDGQTALTMLASLFD